MDNLNYGIIGNCKSAALVSETGSLDWCCLPEFNSSSIFAKILDNEVGGSFEIIADGYQIKQSYINRTNILVTLFEKGEDRFELIDFMPRYKLSDNKYYSPPDIIRLFRYLSGKPTFKVLYDPKLEYGEFETCSEIHSEYIKSYTTRGPYDSLYLYTSFDKNSVLEGKELTLTGDEFFLISYNQKILDQSPYKCYLKLQNTKVYWLNWSDKMKQFACYNEEIVRSALALKLLTFDKTGASIAALTTSLPEAIGEIRNWDYRFCWLRDASMVIKIMTELGHLNVAKRYTKFILDITPNKDDEVQIMYGIRGERELTEKILPHLTGYKDSAPIRIGNAAYKQKQHDIYGVLMDVIYQQFKVFENTLDNGEELWTITRSIVKIVEKKWQEKDKGIWEIRHEQRHFTFSKVLCWVAIDRAIKIAQLINKKEYVSEWEILRDTIRIDVQKNAWNKKKQAFAQSYGSDNLDAAVLLLEPYGFIKATDPMYVKTVKAIQKELSKDGLMYRYMNHDDFGKPKSSFTVCSFWLISALFKIGEKKEAEELFKNLLSYSNHLGLFSEDIDFKTKELLGNFPQAYSHLALIETAINISNGKITSEEKILNKIG